MKPLNQWTLQEIILEVKKVDKKTWIKIGVGLLAAALLLIFVVWPAWITRMEIRQKIKTTQEQILSMESLSHNKPKLLKSKEEYLGFINKSKESLLKPGEAALLLGTIAKFANETKVNLIASNPQEYKTVFTDPFDKLYEGYLYDFTLEGGYHDLAEFMAKIESSAKSLRIEAFHLTTSGEGGEAHVDNKPLIATISISAIAMKEIK